MRIAHLFAFAAAIAPLATAVPAVSAAQIPDHFENLKVLPKDIPRDSLIQVMRRFTSALGVRCEFCHVSSDGSNQFKTMVFKSDDKPEKRNARFMMRMVDSLNHVVLAAMPERSDPPVMLRCVTCHRGLSKPTTLEAMLTATVQRAGVDSAMKEYRDLRQSATLEGKYDFREGTVNELASHLAANGKTAEAISLLQMNEEFYPQSSQIDFELGEVHRQRGERDQAVVSYRLALQKQPQNRAARQRLTELGVAIP